MKRRYFLEHLITAASQAAGAAPTNPIAVVADESGEGLGVFRNATGVAGGLFDFGGAALIAILDIARPIRCVGGGAIMGGQTVYTCTLHNDAGTKEATIAAGTTAADFRWDEGSSFMIPRNGQIQFATTGMTGAGRFWVIVEDAS